MKKYLRVLSCVLFIFHLSALGQVNEQEYYDLIKQVKCVTCQSQSVADSYAPMALIMRKEIYHQFELGKNADQIKLMLVERYGESVLFAPEFKSKHFFIWLLPILLFIVGIFGFKRLLK